MILVILPPILAPLIHTGTSQHSAIRAELTKRGHPYQSFLAIITENGHDDHYGERFHVTWIDINNVSGTTPWIFYIKKDASGKYNCVSVGTGP